MHSKKWQSGSVRLRWSRCSDGYSLIDHPPRDDELPFDLGSEEPGPFIVPNSPRREAYEIAVGEAKVFAELIKTADTDEEIIRFSENWGILGPFAQSKVEFLRFRNQLRNIYRSKFKVHDLSRALESQTLGGAAIKFARKKKGSPIELLWYVLTLSAFCWLEVVEDLGDIDRSHIATCDACGRFFTRTSAKGPAPEHCSNACRQRIYRLRRSEII